MVPVPWGEVEPCFDAVFGTGFSKLLHDIPFPVFVRTVFDRMFRVGTRPETESVVVLGSQDQLLDSGIFRGFHPLFGIQLLRIKKGRGLVTIPPLLVGEGIHVEMDETYDFHGLVIQLLDGRNHPVRLDISLAVACMRE